MIAFLISLQYIFKPSWWIMLPRYSKHLDGIILAAIEMDQVEYIDRYTARIGSVQVWIGNYPYSYGEVHDVRPSRSTIEKLYNHLLNKRLGL